MVQSLFAYSSTNPSLWLEYLLLYTGGVGGCPKILVRAPSPKFKNALYHRYFILWSNALFNFLGVGGGGVLKFWDIPYTWDTSILIIVNLIPPTWTSFLCLELCSITSTRGGSEVRKDFYSLYLVCTFCGIKFSLYVKLNIRRRYCTGLKTRVWGLASMDIREMTYTLVLHILHILIRPFQWSNFTNVRTIASESLSPHYLVDVEVKDIADNRCPWKEFIRGNNYFQGEGDSYG